jgi:hypothetical protein
MFRAIYIIKGISIVAESIQDAYDKYVEMTNGN